MATLVGTSEDFTQVIGHLIELEFDAIEAYKAALDRLELAVVLEQFRSFLADHEQHVSSLKELSHNYNLEIPAGPDVKKVLTQGKVIVAGLIDDQAVLSAMKSNEDDTVTAYERVFNHKGLTADARPVIAQALEDECRHRQWIDSALKGIARSAA